MKDLRARGGIPYGYSISNGDAVINKEESEKLLQFFDFFMSGMNMASSAREAGLICAPSTLPHLFHRKEYTGTEFYPQIISKEYHEQLIEERKRRIEISKAATAKKIWQVNINTEFEIADDKGELPEDPMTYIEAMYEQIVPVKSDLQKGAENGGNGN